MSVRAYLGPDCSLQGVRDPRDRVEGGRQYTGSCLPLKTGTKLKPPIEVAMLFHCCWMAAARNMEREIERESTARYSKMGAV